MMILQFLVLVHSLENDIITSDTRLIAREHRQLKNWNRQKKEELKQMEKKKCKVTSECIDMAVKYMKMLNTNIANYQAQDHRITKQNKTMCK